MSSSNTQFCCTRDDCEKSRTVTKTTSFWSDWAARVGKIITYLLVLKRFLIMCFSELSGELPTFDAPFLVFVFTGYFLCPVRRQSIFASFIVSFLWFGLFSSTWSLSELVMNGCCWYSNSEKTSRCSNITYNVGFMKSGHLTTCVFCMFICLCCVFPAINDIIWGIQTTDTHIKCISLLSFCPDDRQRTLSVT